MKALYKTMLLCTFLFLSVGAHQVTAQSNDFEPTKAEVKTALNHAFADFVEAVRPYYTVGQSYNQFKRSLLLGSASSRASLPNVPQQGEKMLEKAYNYLKSGYSINRIKKEQNYTTMGNAILYVNQQAQERNRDYIEMEPILFGENSTFPTNNLREGRCKWWQLWCHLESVFGPEGGQILSAIIGVIIAIIIP
ncbi:hypothetical protein [Candidatus Ulvibacter alkanivorans]|uniref:hypothetical protein n=1 Tax=Candidatus Ulvibacter alkanivorans TaxID=2267620 RepID=UPI00109CDA0F|nr:hypothetical protein [Candidatus Ulvibacter alkanivorans]